MEVVTQEQILKDALVYLSERSSHLFGVASRTWAKDPKIINNIALALHFIFQKEGEQEFDFQRSEGVSFNPRPARTALILINDAKQTGGAVVVAGILASARHETTIESLRLHPLFSTFSPDVLRFALGAHRLTRIDSATTLSIEPPMEIGSELAQIACALFLDRARQLHRMKTPDRVKTWEKCFSARTRFLTLAEAYSPPLYTMLRTWERRFEARLLESNTTS